MIVFYTTPMMGKDWFEDSFHKRNFLFKMKQQSLGIMFLETKEQTDKQQRNYD